jgi:pimeloyl-ACP methyl ester carboxylesterase
MKKLLLLHGAIGAKEQLNELAKYLSGYELHTLNFSGHGGEPMPDKFSIENFANDVIQYLDKNKIEQINIFGYSMGGYVALYLAAKYPQRVESVFTLATKFDWTITGAEKEVKMLNPEKITEKIPAFADALKLRHAPSDWKLVLNKTAEMMMSLGAAPALNQHLLSSVKQKVIISVGDLDKMVSVTESEKAAAVLSNANFLLLNNFPHPIEQVNTTDLAQKLIAFFV